MDDTPDDAGEPSLDPRDLPPETASFTADGMVQIGEDRLAFKIYHLEGRERHEMTIDGLFQITILRPDLGTAYLVQPDADTFIPLMLEDVSLWPRYRRLEGYRIVPEDEEEEGGEQATRYHITSAGGEEPGMDALVWITQDGIEMRLEGELDVEGITENIVLLRRNIQRGSIDPSLFDPSAAISAVPAPDEIPKSHKGLGKNGP